MITRIGAIGACLLAAGCGGGQLNEAEAEVVFNAVNDVTTEVYGSTGMEMAYRSPSDWTFETTPNGYNFSATLNDGVLWTGTILLDGSLMYDPTDYNNVSYTYGMEFQDVYVARHDVTMNGFVDMSIEYAQTGPTEYTMLYSMSSEMDVTGAANGYAEMSYTVTIVVSDAGYSYTAEGTVNGHDVSGWSMSGMY